MVKRILIISAFFICFANASLAETKCKYFSQADVVDGELINKKEHYTCKENNQAAAEQVYTMLYIATIKALGFN